MGPEDWLLSNLGLVVFTVICVGLIVYLVYVMLYPERV